MRGSADRDEPEEGDEMAMAKAVMQVAQKKLISQVSLPPSGLSLTERRSWDMEFGAGLIAPEGSFHSH